MDKKAQGMQTIINILIVIIMSVAVGLTLFWQFFVTDQNTVDDYLENNLSVTSYNQTIQLENSRLVESSSVVYNNSCESDCSSNLSLLREDSEYSIDHRLGKITFINRTGGFNITYDYNPASRLNTPAGRTLVGIIPVIFVLGLLVMVVRMMIGSQS